MSATRRRATLVVGAADPAELVHRELHFLSVDSKPLNTYTFRLDLLKEGHDDSSGRDFDWWFERLQEAADQYKEKGGPPPEVEFIEHSCVDGIYHQTAWKGLLGKDGDSSRRIHRTNPNLFEFDLKVATVTRTWTRHHLPDWLRGKEQDVNTNG